MASKNIKNDVNSAVWEMEVIFNDTLSSPESAYENAYNFRTFLKKVFLQTRMDQKGDNNKMDFDYFQI